MRHRKLAVPGTCSARRAGRWLGAALLGSLAGAAHGAGFTLGESTQVDTLLNLTYSAAVRTGSQSDRLLANVNGDDGNRNFERGAMINNRAAVLGELGVSHGRFGVFARGSAFYDHAVARRDNDHDAPDTANKEGRHDRFTDAAISRMGRRARLLDAYAYGAFALGRTDLDIRIGNQVVSWGESLFFPNLSGAQNPADATRSNVPGTEVKEILLPAGQVYAQWGLTHSIGLAAYYQWEWKETELTPVGGYFSSTDIVGPGAEFLIVELPPVPLLPPRVDVPRQADITPRNGGQWGLAAKYQLGLGTEIGLHYIRYHDKNPVGAVFENPGIADLVGGNSSYRVLYMDDIDMAALSFSTDLFGTAVVGELSYRWDAGVSVDAPGLAGGPMPTPTRAEVWQANLGATKILLPTALWDQLILVGEISGLRVQNVDAVEAGGDSFDELSNTRDALAVQGQAIFNYRQVLPGINLFVTLAHANALSGKSAIAGALGSLTGVGDRRYRIGLGVRYLLNLEAELAYNFFDGTPDPDKTPLADRSFATFSVKYSF